MRRCLCDVHFIELINFLTYVIILAKMLIFQLKSSIFCDKTPYSPLKVSQCLGRIRRLYLQGQRRSQARKSTKQLSSRETSVHYHRTTRCYIPEDRTLHNHQRENLKINVNISDNQKLLSSLRKRKIRYHSHKSPPLDYILSHWNVVQILIQHFFNIRINIILIPMPW
jgi:hypothetical protein